MSCHPTLKRKCRPRSSTRAPSSTLTAFDADVLNDRNLVKVGNDGSAYPAATAELKTDFVYPSEILLTPTICSGGSNKVYVTSVYNGLKTNTPLSFVGISMAEIEPTNRGKIPVQTTGNAHIANTGTRDIEVGHDVYFCRPVNEAEARCQSTGPILQSYAGQSSSRGRTRKKDGRYLPVVYGARPCNIRTTIDLKFVRAILEKKTPNGQNASRGNVVYDFRLLGVHDLLDTTKMMQAQIAAARDNYNSIIGDDAEKMRILSTWVMELYEHLISTRIGKAMSKAKSGARFTLALMS